MKRIKDISTQVQQVEIWKQFCMGNELAFEQLMCTHYRKLFYYGTKFCRDEDFIKDSIQDLFLELWDRRQFLGEVVTPKPYLMASLRRRLHRETLKKQYYLTDSIDEAPFNVEFSVEESFIHEESTRNLAHEIKSHLDKLPKRQKEVVYLRFFENMSREEIAQVMGITNQSVSNLLQTAVKHLKDTWKTEIIILLFIIITN